MDRFLRESKDQLESALGKASLSIHVVLGNESCDLDSAVSALVWAYCLAKSQKSTGSDWDAVIPVLNIPHQDYTLRTEVKHFLSLVNNIGVSSLVFRDDVDLHSQHAAGKLAVTLVDHNTLPKVDAELDAAVKEVIDHHNNSRHDDPDRDIQVTVETVGSCATLVAEKILVENPSIVDEDIAKLLLGPILVDTVNLSPSAGKATPKDIAMVEALSKICPGLNKDEMFLELQQAKADMSDFSVQDILRKDFKYVHGSSMNIGMSSIPMHLKEFVVKPEIEEELHNFCSSRNLRLLVVMALTVTDDGKTRRQICIYSPISADSMKEELVQTLEHSTSPELLLSELDTDLPGLVVYDQGNVKASRKQVLPLVQDFLDSQEDSSQDEEAAEEPRKDLATDSDVKDMNNTLLKLSSNGNNANDQTSTDNPFDTVISSPDSSGIDAGSVLLDLDLFPSNQSGMMTSESGAFSPGDSTIGITPSSPSSDAMGFGSRTEDLLGLDTFGSVKQTLDFSVDDPGSNPFAQSSGDNAALDAFMSQTTATSDTNENPFSDASDDLFGISDVSESAVPNTESPLSSSNLFRIGGAETSSIDLLGLDPFGGSNDVPSDGNVAASNPFILPDFSGQATVSTTVEHSVLDLGDFMNLPVESLDTVKQQTSDVSADVQTDTKLVSPEDVSESSSNLFAVSGQLSDEPVGMDAFMSQPSEFTNPPFVGFAEASTNPFEVSEPSAKGSVSVSVHAGYHPGSPGSDLAAEPSDEFGFHSLTVSHTVIAGKEMASHEESSENILNLEDVGSAQSAGQDQAASHLTSEITISQTSDKVQEDSEKETISSEKKDESSILDDFPTDESPKISHDVEEINMSVQEPEKLSMENYDFSQAVKTEVEIEFDQRKILQEDENSNLDLGIGDREGLENFAPDENNDQKMVPEDSYDVEATETYSVSEVRQDLIPEMFPSKVSGTNMLEPQDFSSPIDSQNVLVSVEIKPSFDASEVNIFDQTVKDGHDKVVSVADSQVEDFQSYMDVDKERQPTDGGSSKEEPLLSLAETNKEGNEPTDHFDNAHGAQEISFTVSSHLEMMPNPENASVVYEVQSEEMVIEDAEDNVQNAQENDGHAVLSESIVLEPSSSVELETEKSEEQRFSQGEDPQVEFAASASFEEIGAPESTFTPNLELEVTGVAESLAKSPSPLSDEAPAHSSGITSPESDFTSEIISDDPSSGDSYIVTDVSHEVTNFQIEDILEEREEEDDIPTCSGIMEMPVSVGGPSCKKSEGLDEKQLNETPDVVVSEDSSRDIQVGVIDDYFSEEMPSVNGIVDTIPISTDIGFANSGRSTPRNLPDKDIALLQKEAHDLVEEAIKRAQFTFLEEVQRKNREVPTDVSSDPGEEDGIEVDVTEQECAYESGDDVGEPSTDIPVSVDEIFQASNMEPATPEEEGIEHKLSLPTEEVNQLEAAITIKLDDEPATEMTSGVIVVATSAEGETEPPAEEKMGDILDLSADQESGAPGIEILVSGTSSDAADETAASVNKVLQASDIELELVVPGAMGIVQEPDQLDVLSAGERNEAAITDRFDGEPDTETTARDILQATSVEGEAEPPAEEKMEDILDSSTDQESDVPGIQNSISGETASESAEAILKDEAAVPFVDEVFQASNTELEFAVPEAERVAREPQQGGVLPAEEPNQIESSIIDGLTEELVKTTASYDISEATPAQYESTESSTEGINVLDSAAEQKTADTVAEISVSAETASEDVEMILKDEAPVPGMDEVFQASNIELEFAVPEGERATQEPQQGGVLPAEEPNQIEGSIIGGLIEEPITMAVSDDILEATPAQDESIEPLTEGENADVLDSAPEPKSADPVAEISVSGETAAEDVEMILKDEAPVPGMDEVFQASNIELEFAVPEGERVAQETQQGGVLPAEELNQIEGSIIGGLIEEPITMAVSDDILEATPAQDESIEPSTEGENADVLDSAPEPKSADPVAEISVSGETAAEDVEMILKDEAPVPGMDEVFHASNIELEFTVRDAERVSQEPQQGSVSPTEEPNQIEGSIIGGLIEEPVAMTASDDNLEATPAQELELDTPEAEKVTGEPHQEDVLPAELSRIGPTVTIGSFEEPATEIPSGGILAITSAQDESAEPLTKEKTPDALDSVGADQGVSQHETTSDVFTESSQLPVKEEVVPTEVLQEESLMMRNEELPVEVQSSVEEAHVPADLDGSQKVNDLPETELFPTSEMPTESVVPATVDQECEDPAVQLDKGQPNELSISTEKKPSFESEEVVQPPVEVNIVINKDGFQNSKSYEDVTDPSSGGKTKLIVEDSMKDVDMEIENDNRQTSVFGLADILEYVNEDGEVESSTSDSYAVRPNSLSLPAKSTPKSGRLLSDGTPGSMLTDSGTPLTPISLISMDIPTPDTGTDEDILDKDERMKEQDAATSKTVSSVKRSVSIDTEVVEDIHGEWDDKKKLMDIIIEKERTKSLGENSDRPSTQRTMSFASAEAKKRMEGVELPDEWQDDEFSQQKLAGVDSVQDEDSFFKRRVPPKDGKLLNRESVISDDGSIEGMSAWAERLAGDDAFDEDEEESSLPAESREQRSWSASPKKVVPIPAGLSTLSMVGDPRSTPSVPVMSSPSSAEMSWDDDTMQSPGVDPIPEYTAREELEDRRNWRKVVIANNEFTLDMRAINPYKKVLSHGGYYGDGVNAIIVLASCYMPDRSRKDYSYIMNNLFLYVLSTLELLVAEEYMIVYFHGSAPKNRIPSLGWMRKCYQMIDRKLRKNLKGLFIVHPTMWLRTIFRLTRPFISSKFNKKLKFVETLDELPALVNMEYIYIPDEVRRVDKQQQQRKKRK